MRMTRAARPPLKSPPPAVRQRRRADGGWRVWWEPSAAARALGFRPEELAPDTLGMRRAAQLNARAAEALAAAGGAPAGPSPAAGVRIDGARTVRALIADYLADRHFLGLRPATQADYRKAFALIARDWGDALVGALAKPAIRAWREQVAACARPWQPPARRAGETRAHQAKALQAKFAVLLTHAEILGWLPEGANPALRLDGRRRAGLDTPPRARVASWDELGALLRAAKAAGDFSMGVAIALAALTAQRQADILAAEASAFRDGVWTLVRSKRGNLGRVALHPVAHGMLSRWLPQRPEGAGPALLVSERTGRPYSADLFRKVWGAVRREAARETPSVATLQFRDLRRTFGHLARLGGADKADIGQTLGNTAATDPLLELTYMPLANEIAARAIAAIEVPRGLMEEMDG
jgi:integrase